jgi:8-oxo-dGTP pyrophosphatase MutT (NUDIX family)
VDSTPPWTDEPEHWPVHASEDIWRGSAPFAVRRDEISRPGHPDDVFARVVVEHPGAVVVLAVDDSGDAEQVMVLRQYRHPSNLRFVELPAGLLDVPGEDPVVAARRELLEEAGLEAAEWTPLNTLYPSPGISAERIDVYLARGLSEAPDRGGFQPAHEEADMTTHWMPMADLVAGVLERRLTDGPLALAVVTYELTRGSRA